MANKQLTAKVRLNTTQAERSISNLVKKINRMDNTLNGSLKRGSNATNKMNRNLQRTGKLTTLLSQKTNRLVPVYSGIQSWLSKIKNKTNEWYKAQNKVVNPIKTSNHALSSTLSKLKAIAGTYLGMMGGKALLDTTDVIISAENKLNYASAQSIGKDAYNSDGSYSNKVFDSTKDSMDKMYASSQKVRMSYSDMLSNVSKSMTLAGSAFNGNIDNAIRFQEIMAEAYAVGGASAQEMSTSMYQLIQALGAGTLAGDELRSVREGAPLAYKEIEKFAQEIYETDESLKDMAADGLITSEMVVSAIMRAGKTMDSTFKQTEQTFDQTWTQIKNAAMQAFKPVATKLKEMLNNAVDNGLLEKIETAFVNVSKVLLIAFTVIENCINWVVDNWDWLKDVLVSGLLTIASLMVATAIVSAVAWIVANWQLVLLAIGIYAVIYALWKWQEGTMTTTDLILNCLGVIAIAIMVLGLVFHSTTTFMVGLALLAIIFIASQSENLCDFIVKLCQYVAMAIIIILAVVLIAYLVTGVIMMSIPALIALCVIAAIAVILMIFFKFTEEVCGGVMWLGAVILDILIIIWNTIAFIVNLIVGIVLWALATIWNVVAGVINGIIQALWNNLADPVINVIEWMLNACNGGFNSFGDAVFNLLGQICNSFLSLGKIVTKIIDAIFGTDWTSGIEKLQDEVLAWGKNEQAITISRDAPELPRIDATDAFNTGYNLLGYAELVNPMDAYDTGAAWGSNLKDKINSWGDSFNAWGDKGANGLHDKLKGLGDLDKIGNALGLDFSNLGFPSPEDISGVWKEPDKDKLLSGVDSIDDKMDLTDDDLEYLRKIAEMEWRKEFTTAEIKVDMTNNNNINGERDWEGMLTYLSDTLREEMISVSEGVHVR